MWGAFKSNAGGTIQAQVGSNSTAISMIDKEKQNKEKEEEHKEVEQRKEN